MAKIRLKDKNGRMHDFIIGDASLDKSEASDLRGSLYVKFVSSDTKETYFVFFGDECRGFGTVGVEHESGEDSGLASLEQLRRAFFGLFPLEDIQILESVVRLQAEKYIQDVRFVTVSSMTREAIEALIEEVNSKAATVNLLSETKIDVERALKIALSQSEKECESTVRQLNQDIQNKIEMVYPFISLLSEEVAKQISGFNIEIKDFKRALELYRSNIKALSEIVMKDLGLTRVICHAQQPLLVLVSASELLGVFGQYAKNPVASFRKNKMPEHISVVFSAFAWMAYLDERKCLDLAADYFRATVAELKECLRENLQASVQQALSVFKAGAATVEAPEADRFEH